MKKIQLLVTGVVALSILSSCCGNANKCTAPCDQTAIGQNVINHVIGKADQAALTPDAVLAALKSGNEAYVKDSLTVRSNKTREATATNGQFPQAAIVSCLDSRVMVEDIFQQGNGDVFVARVAGNTVNTDILGSLEFACKVVGSKVIVVMGHDHCGAVQAAISDVKLGNITGMLAPIKPAVAAAGKSFDGEKTATNEKFVDAVCKQNVQAMISIIRTKSPILKEMESKKEITIVGAVYEMATGQVTFL